MDALKFTEFKWKNGYGYTIDPASDNWYFVVSYFDNGKMASYGKVSHSQYVSEPVVKSFPTEVSRKFIAIIFGERYIASNAVVT